MPSPAGYRMRLHPSLASQVDQRALPPAIYFPLLDITTLLVKKDSAICVTVPSEFSMTRVYCLDEAKGPVPFEHIWNNDSHSIRTDYAI